MVFWCSLPVSIVIFKSHMFNHCMLPLSISQCLLFFMPGVVKQSCCSPIPDCHPLIVLLYFRTRRTCVRWPPRLMRRPATNLTLPQAWCHKAALPSEACIMRLTQTHTHRHALNNYTRATWYKTEAVLQSAIHSLHYFHPSEYIPTTHRAQLN